MPVPLTSDLQKVVRGIYTRFHPKLYGIALDGMKAMEYSGNKR
jgi:hypothetical protein